MTATLSFATIASAVAISPPSPAAAAVATATINPTSVTSPTIAAASASSASTTVPAAALATAYAAALAAALTSDHTIHHRHQAGPDPWKADPIATTITAAHIATLPVGGGDGGGDGGGTGSVASAYIIRCGSTDRGNIVGVSVGCSSRMRTV